MSKFIQSYNGTFLNLDHVVEIRHSTETLHNGIRMPLSHAILTDDSQHRIFPSDLENDLSQLVPACPDDNAIIGIVMSDGIPEENFPVLKIVAWRIGFGEVKPVLCNTTWADCDNVEVGLIQRVGEVEASGAGRFDTVDGFKAYVTQQTLTYKQRALAAQGEQQ